MKRTILLIAMSSLALTSVDASGQTTAPAPAPAAVVAPPPPQQQPRVDEYAERYGILTDKNIFVRNRPPTRKGGPPTAERPRRPEESFVLTGLTLQEGRNVAFIENTATRTTERVVQGASIAGGKIIDVRFDSLEFETGGSRFRVGIGRNLLGDVSRGSNGGGSAAANSSSPSTTAPAGGTASGSNAAAPSVDDANLSVEERMKRDRAKLLGQ
jgi:hypothetical protein